MPAIKSTVHTVKQPPNQVVEALNGADRSPSDDPHKTLESPTDWRLVLFGFAAIMLCYLDRINLSVAIVPMAEDYGWNNTVKGAIMSAFFAGYLLTQVIGGRLADRFGTRWVLAGAVLLWSAFTILTPPAAAINLAVLLLVRVLLGAGEGVSFPSLWSLYGRCIPVSARARAATITVAGVPAGTVAGLLLTPIIIVYWGWPWAFYAFGILGLLWVLAWLWYTRTLASGGRVQAFRQESGTVQKVGLLRLLQSKAVWAIVCAHFAANWTTYVLLAWLPTYVTNGLGVAYEIVGVYAMVPSIMGFVGLLVSGWIADSLITSGMNLTRVRKLMTAVGLGGMGLALGMVGFIASAEMAIAVMSVGTFFGFSSLGGFGVNHMDIAPRHAGTLMGISNTAGTLPGVIGVYVTGLILDATGSWALVFGTAGSVALFGLVVYLLFASTEKLFD